MNDVFANLYRALETSGQLDNTLIVFTSDNGPEAEVPPHGRTPFRGAKGSTWEGGVRVPTFVYWKGMIQPRKSDGIVDLADLFPTSLSLAGHPGAELAKLVPSKPLLMALTSPLSSRGQTASLTVKRNTISSMVNCRRYVLMSLNIICLSSSLSLSRKLAIRADSLALLQNSWYDDL